MTAHKTPQPITLALVPTKSRKEATAKRLKEETQREQAYIAGKVIMDDTARRHKWNSLNPNHNFLDDYASGFFGKRRNRDVAIWDEEAHQDAVATFEGYCRGPQPWKGAIHKGQIWVEDTTDSGHWEPTADQQSITLPEPEVSGYNPFTTTSSALKVVTKKAINEAYETFAANPEVELSNLQVSLYAFAPTQGRLNRCKSLLWHNQSDLSPEDIIADFVMDLLDRFSKGQYQHHDGRFHHWIAHVWGKWFFPSVQEKVIRSSNLTVGTEEDEYIDDDEEIERSPNVVSRREVHKEVFTRNTESWTEPSRLASRILSQLDDPSTVYGSLNETAKMMLRDIAKGATKKQAAKRCGISERYARKLLTDVLDKVSSAMVDISACADQTEVRGKLLPWPTEDVTFDIQACADSAKFLTPDEAAVYLGGLNSRTMTRWAREGYIPAIPIGEGKRRLWRFLQADLEEWMLARRQGGQNAA